MQIFLSGLVMTASLAVIVAVILSRRFVNGLTLLSSWRWAVAGTVSVVIAMIVTSRIVAVSPAWCSAAQYFAATMLLTPLVAALGARRPGNAAWQWFVVLPMIVVLQWPAMTQLLNNRGREAIDLGAPATIGVLLVIAMSAGTLLGTSMTLPALMYVAAVLCCFLPSSGWIESASAIPLLSPLLLLAAQTHAASILRTCVTASRSARNLAESTDAAWQLFQTLYGLVWTRRVLDRINQFAPGEQWTVTLTLPGFRRSNGAAGTDADLAKPLEAFRWVLSRFADPAWIEKHVSNTAADMSASDHLKSEI